MEETREDATMGEGDEQRFGLSTTEWTFYQFVHQTPKVE
jgi:hypothetical protein